MIIYNTNVKIYQDDPPRGEKNCRSTKTLNGYIRYANQLYRTIIGNRTDYKWLVTINFTNEYDASEHAKLWKHVSRNLRKSSIEALAVREPSESNKLHYHIIVCDNAEYQTRRDIVNLFNKAFPKHYKNVPKLYRLRVERILDYYNVALYVAKGKRHDERDKNSDKRLLFSKDFKLDKCCTIGNFWKRKKADIWTTVVEKAKQWGEARDKLTPEDYDQIYNDTENLSKKFDVMYHEALRKLTASKIRSYLNPSLTYNSQIDYK